MAFRVGQKVVCVNDSPRNAGKIINGIRVTPSLDGLRAKEIYTVRSLGDCWTDSAPGICLAEIKRATHPRTGSEITFFVGRFRPLTERKADMEARNELFRKWETHKEQQVTSPLDEQTPLQREPIP